MRTEYRIDAFQQTYFVLDSFEQLFEACYDTDFAPIYRAPRRQHAIAADARSGDVAVARSPVRCGCSGRRCRSRGAKK